MEVKACLGSHSRGTTGPVSQGPWNIQNHPLLPGAGVSRHPGVMGQGRGGHGQPFRHFPWWRGWRALPAPSHLPAVVLTGGAGAQNP